MARGSKTGGRLKGTPNKTSAAVKEALEFVYARLQEDAGDQHGHLLIWAKEQPTEFYKLFAKLLPQQIKAEVGGFDGLPMVVRWAETSEEATPDPSKRLQ